MEDGALRALSGFERQLTASGVNVRCLTLDGVERTAG